MDDMLKLKLPALIGAEGLAIKTEKQVHMPMENDMETGGGVYANYVGC